MGGGRDSTVKPKLDVKKTQNFLYGLCFSLLALKWQIVCFVLGLQISDQDKGEETCSTVASH